jgi:cryptochrome 1
MSASPSSLSGGAGEAAMRTVVWFRRDLRVEDNPALSAAARTAGEVVPAYVWAPEEDGPYYPGRVSRWWLSQSLKHLDASLRRLGASRLVTRRSTDTVAALLELVRSTGATHLFFNHLYGSIPISHTVATLGQLVIAVLAKNTASTVLAYYDFFKLFVTFALLWPLLN